MSAAAAPVSGAGEVSIYAPLEDGTVLSYDTVSEGSSERGLVVLQVRRPRTGVVELDDGGHVERLREGPDGLSRVSGGYWLRPPLVRGACFPGRQAEVCITATDAAVRVPAGSFTGCLETVEESGRGDAATRTRTVFCPHVGMVLLEVDGTSDGDPVRERAELRYHGPRIDLGLPSE